jgi:hypothetical protein
MDLQPLSLLKTRFWIAALAAILPAFSALFFIRSMTNAAFYSAWYGTPRLASELAYANRQAEIFFFVSLALALLATGCMAPFLRFAAISSDGFRITVRYIASLAISVIATAVFVWVLSVLGVGAVPGAFSK